MSETIIAIVYVCTGGGRGQDKDINILTQLQSLVKVIQDQAK